MNINKVLKVYKMCSNDWAPVNIPSVGIRVAPWKG